MQDRRTHARTPLGGTAYVTYNGRCREETVTDAGPGGLLVQSTWRLRRGKSVQVFLPLEHADGWRMCLLKGEVVRRGRGELAIRFRDGEKDTRALLAEHLKHC